MVHLAQNRALVNTAMNLGVPKKGKFLSQVSDHQLPKKDFVPWSL
jgi:hypothetical protein